MKDDATHLNISSPTHARTQAASNTNDQHARQQQADKGTSNKNSLSPSRDQGNSQPDSLNPESSKLPTENASKKSGDRL